MKIIKSKLKKVTTPKGRIIAFSIFIFFTAIIIGGLWYWNTHKKAIIKNKMETAVRKKSDGLYKIQYDSLEMDEVNGYLSISHMTLLYDSVRYIELQKLDKAPSILISIHIPNITISGVKTPKTLINDQIVGRKLELKDPLINIMYANSGKDSSRVAPTKEVYEQILGNLDFIQVDTVLITGGQ